MIQQVLVIVLFLSALMYVGRLVYLSFQSRTGCATGCGKCGALDVNKIETQLREKGY